MNYEYTVNKEKARVEAIDWQLDFQNDNYSWTELTYFTEYFRKLTKRYGLTKEFRENGII